MHALLEELGIELFPAYRDGDDVYVDEEGRGHRHSGDAHGLSSAEERALAEADGKLDALAKELDPEAPWEHPLARELDTITFDEWLRSEVADEVARENLRSYLADGFVTKPAYSFSLLQGLWVIAGAGGTYELFAPEQCLAYRVVGGSQLVPIRIADELGERVVLESPVRAIAWSDEGVQVDAGHVHVKAGAAIVAVAPNLAAGIRFEPALPAWRMRLQQASSQGSVTKILGVYPEPFWRAEGLSGEGFAPHQLVRELYDNSPPSASVGVLCTFLPGEQAEFAGRLNPKARRELVLEGMAKFVGPAALQATDYIETDWSAEEWTRGAYASTFGIGGLTRFGPDLRRPVGPIHWACSDSAGFGHMHMEGAARSGEAAAAELL
jgi:putrescine oxidase